MISFRSLLFALPLLACEQQPTRLPMASGAQGEVLVVMDKGHWESGPGAMVRSILERPIGTLPQREPRFKVVHCTPRSFGPLLKTHHSVLLASIGLSGDTATTKTLLDRFAQGQLVLQVTGSDGTAWERSFAEVADAALDRVEAHQFDRIGVQLAKERDAALVEAVERAHDVVLDIPGGYRMMKQDSGFTWLQRDRIVSGAGLEHNVIEGLLIHHHPYRSDTLFNVNSLVDVRDSVTRAHVEGPAAGTFMIVQRRFETLDLMPKGRATTVDGRYTYIMHGLFGMEGAKMGGPFVSLSTVCEPQARLITVEGFVYAPQFNKREYVREMEALLRTMRFGPKCIPLSPKG